MTDRSLSGLRRQISGLIPEGASVIEVGSANGTLLLENAARIERALGVDLDEAMVRFASRRAADADYQHIRFECADARELESVVDFSPDVAIASLILHEMEWDAAVATLSAMARISKRVIVVDFIEPPNLIAQALLLLDETLAGHVGRYLNYRRAGGMPARLEAAGVAHSEPEATSIPVIGIWDCAP